MMSIPIIAPKPPTTLGLSVTNKPGTPTLFGRTKLTKWVGCLLVPSAWCTSTSPTGTNDNLSAVVLVMTLLEAASIPEGVHWFKRVVREWLGIGVERFTNSDLNDESIRPTVSLESEGRVVRESFLHSLVKMPCVDIQTVYALGPGEHG